MTEPDVGIGRLDVLDLRSEAAELRAAARELRAKARELRARSAELRDLTKRFTSRAEETDGTAHDMGHSRAPGVGLPGETRSARGKARPGEGR
jgi:hypothetical protein